MKTTQLISVLCVILFFSCKKDEEIVKIETPESNSPIIRKDLPESNKGFENLSYEKSKSQWMELKNKNGDSYIYQVTFSSWSGFGSVTEIQVKEGVVISRKYESYDNITDKSKIADSYIENKAELGNHKTGAAPLTIDELYSTCLSDYLSVDQDKNEISFYVDANGMMINCSYYPKECMDDCMKGISISAFKWE